MDAALLIDGLSILQHEMTQQPVQTKTRKHEGNTLQAPTQLYCGKNLHKRRRLSSQSSEEDMVVSLPKRLKAPSFIVRNREVSAFFRLLEDPHIYNFIQSDTCKLVADKYLLAMVFTYFKRASLSTKHYDRMNFFVALYLACDMEEDEEEYKYEIFPWALGSSWRAKYMKFLRMREKLWSRIGFRAIVSRKCCDEMINIEPNHWAWQRTRPEYHGGATRAYMQDSDDESLPRGPNASPKACKLCSSAVEYDSASPGSTTWYLSSSTESSPDLLNSNGPNKILRLVSSDSRFNMSGLQNTLDEDEGIWACVNEQ